MTHGLYSPWNGDLPYPGIEPRPPALQMDSLLAERPGKPKNTGVVSHSPSPGDLPNPGIELMSPTLQADSLPDEPPRKPRVSVDVINLHLSS